MKPIKDYLVDDNHRLIKRNCSKDGEGGLRLEYNRALQNIPEQVFHFVFQIPANKPANKKIINRII